VFRPGRRHQDDLAVEKFDALVLTEDSGLEELEVLLDGEGSRPVFDCHSTSAM